MSQPDFSLAADRNKQPILDALCRVLPERGSALEIASGTGQHVAWFASGLPDWTWQPTDAQPGALNSIAQRVAQLGLSNVRAPLQLDVMAAQWLPDDARFDAVFCANMLHNRALGHLRRTDARQRTPPCARRRADHLWPVSGGRRPHLGGQPGI